MPVTSRLPLTRLCFHLAENFAVVSVDCFAATVITTWPVAVLPAESVTATLAV